MADLPATPDLSLTDQTVAQLRQVGQASQASGTAVTTGVFSLRFEGYKFLEYSIGGPASTPGVVTQFPSNYPAVLELGPRDQWFEMFHVLPRSLVLGNILTNINRTLDLYSAFTSATHYLVSFTNNAGAGTSITNLPALPVAIPAQTSLLLTLLVTPNGPATINTTLDFAFDVETDHIPITGVRIVMFPFEPESPLTERLTFLTDIIPHLDDTEQRIANRLAPRQAFDLVLRREDGEERERVNMLLFDWQSRVFGFPIWTEPSLLTAAVTAGQTSVNVDDTTLADYRVGGLAIIYYDDITYDALEIQSISATVISFTTGTVNNYPIGTRVMPLRTAVTSEPAREKRYANNLADISLTMRVTDNNVDLSDTSAFPTFNGKVLLDEPNAIKDALEGVIERSIVVFDSDTGIFSQGSKSDRARRSSAKTFVSRTRTRLWAIRRLLHALRGRQVSFYLPTFSKELVLASNYTSGAASISIINVGYTKYARQRSPMADIRIVLTDGTTYVRTITNSAEAGLSETLTLSSTISANINTSQIKRIEFFEKVRFDTDEFVFEHTDANGSCQVGAPVKVVLE